MRTEQIAVNVHLPKPRDKALGIPWHGNNTFKSVSFYPLQALMQALPVLLYNVQHIIIRVKVFMLEG